MFAPLLGAVRADIDRQLRWMKGELRRQTRHTALIGVFATAAVLAALGAVVVGLTALYSWLAAQTGPFVAYGVIGGGLALIALFLSTLVFIWRRPRVASRPPLQIARPAALLEALGHRRYRNVLAGGEQTLRLATGTVRNGSRSTLFSTLAIAAVLGLMAGRRL
jgi:hypothetical protein